MKFNNKEIPILAQTYLSKINVLHLRKKPLLKKNIKGLKNSAGRNNSGKITIRHKGSGHKKKYRKINFYRNNISTGITCNIEYDPNRNSYIAAIHDFVNNKFFYILAPKHLKIGDIIASNSEIKTEPRLGYSLPITEIPIGTYIHNISFKASKPAKLSRAAGTFSRVKEKTENFAILDVNFKEDIEIPSKCYATIGIVSNEFVFLARLKKAGQSRWLNKRPTVRGVAMNPIDHPHGGGEGKKSGKNKTPWGKSNRKNFYNNFKTDQL